jgi:predicted ATPase
MPAELVRADDLVPWSERLEAMAVLPELVRRLLWATAFPRKLEFRAEAGVRAPGFDGVLETHLEGAYWPAGTSIWELSVRVDVGTKANEDYRTRTAEVPAEARAQLTYVAATSRRWTGKEDWVTERRSESAWADVRVLDADSLGAWIAAAPAVALWFASTQFGRPVDDETDVGSYAASWAQRTQPPLPEDLPSRGVREASAQQLVAWWSAPASVRSTSIAVVDDSRDEAIAFIAATCSAHDALRARTIVVTSERAVRWHGRDAGLVLVPSFALRTPPVAGGARLILPLSREARAPSGALVLERPRREDLARALVEVHVPLAEAQRHAQEAGGRLLPLQRRLGFVSTPAWAQGVPLAIVQALLLAARWVPVSSGDRAFLARLGADAAEAEAACARLVTVEGAPIVRRPGSFEWAARGDAWSDFAPTLSGGLLRTFESGATEVLGEDDPALDLEPDRRFYAPILGKTRGHSEALREGICDTLVRLAVHEQLLEPAVGAGVGSAIAHRVVRAVLGVSWKRWASLDRLLPTLAEAAPDGFLESLGDSLAAQDDGVSRLLDQVTGTSHPYTGLLWALERTAFLRPHVNTVVEHLAELAARDRAVHNHVNRPMNSLCSLVMPWLPQSATTLDERLAIIERVVARWGDVGWRLMLSHLTTHGMITKHARPEYRPYDPGEGDEIPPDQVAKQVEAVHERARTCAGKQAERLTVLLEKSYRFHRDLGDRVLDDVEKKQTQIDEPLRVWLAIRQELYLTYLRQGDAEETARVAARLRAAYEAFTPDDPVARVGWLFSARANLPDDSAGDYKKAEARAGELRAEAIRALLAREDGWNLVARLGREGEHRMPGFVAEALIATGWSSDAIAKYLASDGDEVVGEVGACVLAQHAAVQGLATLTVPMKELLQQGRVSSALSVALRLPATPGLWDLLDASGGELPSLYWRQLYAPFVAHSGDIARAARAFLAAGRPEAAVDSLAEEKGALATELALEALESLGERLPELVEKGWHDSYDVDRLLARLDADPSAPDDRLILLEMRLLGVMHSVSPTARLPRALGEHPELFVTAVTACYRADGDPPRELTPAEQRAANGGQVLLERWKGYPGIDLPPVEREERLLAWSRDVLDRLHGVGRVSTAGIKLGEVLARAPAGDDGVWPCPAARQLLDAGLSPTLAHGLHIAKRNQRGVTTKAIGEGGPQERGLARDFAEMAGRVKDSSPATADMLRKLADSYVREAQRSDDDAEADRDEYDLGPASDSPRAARSAVEAKVPEHLEVVRELRVSGFRCFQQASLWLSPLTVVVGDTGTGKSALTEAFAVLRRVATPRFVDDVDALFGGMTSILRPGSRDLELSVRIVAADGALPELTYELTLVREVDGRARVLRERLLDSSASSSRLLSDAGLSRRSRTEESEEVRVAFERVSQALRGIEVHVGFDVAPAWATRTAARVGGSRDASAPDQGDRVQLFGASLASAYAVLRTRPTWATDLLPDLQRVLRDVVDVRVRPEASTGNPALALVRGGQTIRAGELAGGELAWLALLATLALADGSRTLVVLDEPAPTIPGHHIAPLLEKYASRVPLLYFTAASTLPAYLANPERDVRVSGLGAAGASAVIGAFEKSPRA